MTKVEYQVHFTRSNRRLLTMKIALFLTAIAGASAFAPVNQPSRASSQLNAGELEGIRGVGPETAGKIVSLSPFWEEPGTRILANVGLP